MASTGAKPADLLAAAILASGGNASPALRARLFAGFEHALDLQFSVLAKFGGTPEVVENRGRLGAKQRLTQMWGEVLNQPLLNAKSGSIPATCASTELLVPTVGLTTRITAFTGATILIEMVRCGVASIPTQILG